MGDQRERQYMAYMFTIPVLFCIIFFMMLFLFYLTNRTSSAAALSSHPPSPPAITRTPSFAVTVCAADLKEDLRDKLPTIVFDEELKARDLSCCVCLGEFEMKEELIQVPSCKHIFHRDCIRNWLSSNTTCPLCRSSVVVADNTHLIHPPPPPEISPAVVIPTTTIVPYDNELIIWQID